MFDVLLLIINLFSITHGHIFHFFFIDTLNVKEVFRLCVILVMLHRKSETTVAVKN